MRGFQPEKQITKRQGYAEGGLVRGFKLMLGIEKSPYAEEAKRYREAQAAKAAQEAAAKQPMQKPLNNISNYSSGEATKRRMAAIDEYADGGMIRGKGTGTSDSIKKDARVGSYIMPADSTEAIGEQTLAGMGKKVPVAVSNGEFEMPPEQVHAIGVQALDQIKNATHTPVARGLPGYTPQNQEPRQFFASGGAVDDMSRWQAASDALRQSNDRIAASQGRVNMQAPDGRFDEAKLEQAANMVQQSRLRMGTQAPVSNPNGSMNMQRVAALSNMVADSRARGFAPEAARQYQENKNKATAIASNDQNRLRGLTGYQPRQYLADGGVTEWDETDAAKAAALAGGAAYKAGVTPTAVAGAAKNAASSVGQFAKAGRMAAGEVSVLPKGSVPSSKLGKAGVVGALASTGLDVANTNTDQYRKRFGMETDNPSLAGDLGARALGAASDLGNVLTLGLAGKYYRDKQEQAANSTGQVDAPQPNAASQSDSAQPEKVESPVESQVAGPNTPAAANSTSPVATELANGVYKHGRGQYSDSANGMGFSTGFTGQPSAQTMAAIDGLAARNGSAPVASSAVRGLPSFDPSTIQHSGNSWEARNNLRNLQVGMNSMRSTNASRAAGLAAYKSALDADARARGAENEAGITAMRENAAIARQGMQEQGANFRDANRNALEAQRLGQAAQESAFNRGVKGFDIQNAQRKQYIQSLMDAATTPEERKAIAERFPDVYGPDSKTKMQFEVIRGKNDPITGAYSGDYAVAFDPETRTIQRMDIGGASQPDTPIPQAVSERVVGHIYTAPNGQKVKWDGKGLLPA